VVEQPSQPRALVAGASHVLVARRARAKPSADPGEPGLVEPVASDSPAEPGAPGIDAAFLTDPVSEPASSALAPAPVLPRAPATSLSPKPVVREQELGPKQLSSKLGHTRLAINPSAPAYRVRVPPALEHGGQSFNATVRICVSGQGKVTNVHVLRSAGAAIDKQIPGVLSRWRYRPLVEDGRALPFCYVLQYEVAGR